MRARRVLLSWRRELNGGRLGLVPGMPDGWGARRLGFMRCTGTVMCAALRGRQWRDAEPQRRGERHGGDAADSGWVRSSDDHGFQYTPGARPACRHCRLAPHQSPGPSAASSARRNAVALTAGYRNSCGSI